MQDNFSRLVNELRAADLDRQKRKTVVAVRRWPNQGELKKSFKLSASDKDAISKVRASLDAIAVQKDVRHRLGLAHSAGALSKAKYLHFSKILDNGGELPADISRALASIKIANADNDIGTDPQQNNED